MDKAVEQGEEIGGLVSRAAARAQRVSEQEITERILSAVIEQRLPPGTKLSENVLCDAFGVSRARIRRALRMLAEHEVVELRVNCGAFIARPSAENARHVFAARRAIEPTIARDAVRQITEAQLTRVVRTGLAEGDNALPIDLCNKHARGIAPFRLRYSSCRQ